MDSLESASSSTKASTTSTLPMLQSNTCKCDQFKCELSQEITAAEATITTESNKDLLCSSCKSINLAYNRRKMIFTRDEQMNPAYKRMKTTKFNYYHHHYANQKQRLHQHQQQEQKSVQRTRRKQQPDRADQQQRQRPVFDDWPPTQDEQTTMRHKKARFSSIFKALFIVTFQVILISLSKYIQWLCCFFSMSMYSCTQHN